MILPVTGTIRWAGIESLRIQTEAWAITASMEPESTSRMPRNACGEGRANGRIHHGDAHRPRATYGSVVRDSYVHHSGDYNYAADCYGVVTRCGSATTSSRTTSFAT